MKKQILSVLTVLCLAFCVVFLFLSLAEPAFAENDDYGIFNVALYPKDALRTASALTLDEDHPYYYNGDSGASGRTSLNGNEPANAWLDGGTLHLNGYDAGKLYIRVPEAGKTAKLVLEGTNYLQNGIYAMVYNPDSPTSTPIADAGLRIEGSGRLEITFHAPGTSIKAGLFMGIMADYLTIDTTNDSPEADIIISAETLTSFPDESVDPLGAYKTFDIGGIASNHLHFTGCSDLDIHLVQNGLQGDMSSSTSQSTIAIGKAINNGDAEFVIDSTGKISIDALTKNTNQYLIGIGTRCYDYYYRSPEPSGSVTIRNTEISMRLSVPLFTDTRPTSVLGIYVNNPTESGFLTIDGAKLDIDIDAAYSAIGIDSLSHKPLPTSAIRIINGSEISINAETQDRAKAMFGEYSQSSCYGFSMYSGTFLLDDSKLNVRVRGGDNRALYIDSWNSNYEITDVTFSGSSEIVLDNDPESEVDLPRKSCSTYAAYFRGNSDNPLTLTFDFAEGGYFTTAADTLADNEYGRNYYTQQIYIGQNVNLVYGEGTKLVSGEEVTDQYSVKRICKLPTPDALAEGPDSAGYYKAYDPALIFGLITLNDIAPENIPLPVVGDNSSEYDISGISVQFCKTGQNVLKWSCMSPDASDFSGIFELGAVYRADIPIEAEHGGITLADSIRVTGLPKGWAGSVYTYAEYYGDSEVYGTEEYAGKRILSITFPKLIIPAKAVIISNNKEDFGQELNSEYRYLVNGCRSQTGKLGVNGCTVYFDQDTGTLYLKDYQGNYVLVDSGVNEGDLILDLQGSSSLCSGVWNRSDGSYDLTVISENEAFLSIGPENGRIENRNGNIIISGKVNVSVGAISDTLNACGILAGNGKALSIKDNASLCVLAATVPETDAGLFAYGIKADSVLVDTNGSVAVRSSTEHGAANLAVLPSTPELGHPAIVITRASSYLFQSSGATGTAIYGNAGITVSENMSQAVMPMDHDILQDLDIADRTRIQGNNLAYYGYLLPGTGKSIEIRISDKVILNPAVEVSAFSKAVVFNELSCEGYWVDPEDADSEYQDAYITVVPGVELELCCLDRYTGNNSQFWCWNIFDNNDYYVPVQFAAGSSLETKNTRFTVPDIFEMKPTFDDPGETGEYELPMNIFSQNAGIFKSLYVSDKEPEYNGQPATCGPRGSGSTIEYDYDGDGEVSVQWYYYDFSAGTLTALDAAPVNALTTWEGVYTVGLSATAGSTTPAVTEVTWGIPTSYDAFSALSGIFCNSFQIKGFSLNRTDGRIQYTLSVDEWVYNGICPDVKDIITGVRADLDGDGVFETAVHGCSYSDRTNDGGSVYAGTKHYRITRLGKPGGDCNFSGIIEFDFNIVAAEHDFTIHSDLLQIKIGRGYYRSEGYKFRKEGTLHEYKNNMWPVHPVQFITSPEEGITYEYAETGGEGSDFFLRCFYPYPPPEYYFGIDSFVSAGTQFTVDVTAPERDLNNDGINEYKATTKQATITAVANDLEIDGLKNYTQYKILRNGHTETVLKLLALYDEDGRFLGFDSNYTDFQFDLGAASPEDLIIENSAKCKLMLLDPVTLKPLCSTFYL